MSGVKDQFQRTRIVIESLVAGVHPKTGIDLSEDSVVNESEVIRAMSTAVLALDQMSARLARRAQLPESVGKNWTEEEEQRLRNEFTGPGSIPDIAIKHRRTTRAIEARLEKLGLLRPDQRKTVSPSASAKLPEDDK
jgi:hypothetical protein